MTISGSYIKKMQSRICFSDLRNTQLPCLRTNTTWNNTIGTTWPTLCTEDLRKSQIGGTLCHFILIDMVVVVVSARFFCPPREINRLWMVQVVGNSDGARWPIVLNEMHCEKLSVPKNIMCVLNYLCATPIWPESNSLSKTWLRRRIQIQSHRTTAWYSLPTKIELTVLRNIIFITCYKLRIILRW